MHRGQLLRELGLQDRCDSNDFHCIVHHHIRHWGHDDPHFAMAITSPFEFHRNLNVRMSINHQSANEQDWLTPAVRARCFYNVPSLNLSKISLISLRIVHLSYTLLQIIQRLGLLLATAARQSRLIPMDGYHRLE